MFKLCCEIIYTKIFQEILLFMVGARTQKSFKVTVFLDFTYMLLILLFYLSALKAQTNIIFQ